MTTKQSATPKTKKSISDYAKVNKEDYLTHKPDDFLNQPLQLNSFEWKEGSHNAVYVVLDVTVKRTAEKVIITCGHKPIVDLLGQLPDDAKPPLDFRFERVGRTIMMV